ncbi:hypothetical protein WISP_86313 [Willisornis vidua]|uniref:Uncharacterized protein n=1 Tax=Willisornis vidua TaxID=1566151 RepID=A0ABQ9D822_9PASS|nr:hypothetical protein WISP_86313 [Willisornis vidua]
MEDNGGAEIHLEPVDKPMSEQASLCHAYEVVVFHYCHVTAEGTEAISRSPTMARNWSQASQTRAVFASGMNLYMCPWLPFGQSSERIKCTDQSLPPLSGVSQAVVTAPPLVSDLTEARGIWGEIKDVNHPVTVIKRERQQGRGWITQ